MTFKEFFAQDKASRGVLAVVLAEAVPAILLIAVLLIIGEPVKEHIRWMAGAAVPALLVVQAYARHKEALNATRGAIVTLFVTFITFMLILIKTKTI